ncbi:ParB-like nuclease family protein [Pontibacter ummariensis]|uniref:ParB-like nuclease domain-containing protein n=1 Tax=Pontibacter ummariensis TaxID=1610492 RepID=A0A239LJ47_9BACT|nr:ParB N-terminal domain-containing protein [Pontibacter ummariensis]PRY03361.1 ParB-like nuclease family protein [Pontibacter ummariensis]SNT29932.1 ParB-like nuclease domain-containing protein [Pontibacter ummariensis]
MYIKVRRVPTNDNKLTDKQVDFGYFSLENQRKRNEENIKREKDKKCFKNLLKDPNFKIQPKWHLSKNDIDLSHLKGECHTDLKSSSDYNLYEIERTELFRILDSSYLSTYTKEKIWKSHEDNKITEVLVNWQSAVNLIPPVLILNSNEDKLLIQDGKHRFAVANYFEAKDVPIIILNTIEKRFLELADSNKLKKLS